MKPVSLRAAIPALLLAALAPALARPATAETERLVTGVSTDTVSIESNFTGAKIVVFGTIEREAGAAVRHSGYDVVVIVRGPGQDITARRKARIAGVWVNRDSRHYVEAPSYLAVLASRPPAEFADEPTLARYQLGLDHLILLEAGSAAGLPGPETEKFNEAVVRLMRDRALYVEDTAGVVFLSPTLFKAEVRLPAHILVGAYTTEVYLFADGELLGRTEAAIAVRKTGVEQLVTNVATGLPLVYGLAVVALAILFGWSAGFIFRRD